MRTRFTQSVSAGRVTGEALPIAKELEGTVTFNFSASPAGVLAYTAGTSRLTQLTWFDRAGKVLGLVGGAGQTESVALSPDGQAVAFSRADPQTESYDVWLHDLARGTESRFTFGGDNHFPRWSTDGKRVFFSQSDRTHQKSASGNGPEQLLDTPAGLLRTGESPDGQYMSLGTTNNNPVTGNDIWLLPLFGDRKPVPLLKTEYTEHDAAVSPDGRWLAYASDESGQEEVYVTRFPSGQGKWRISNGGGNDPIWRHDGQELFYHGHGKFAELRLAREGKPFRD